MKVKVLIFGVLVCGMLVFAGNWIYGNKSAAKLDQRIQLSIQKEQLPFDISYDKVHVNPLFSEFVFYDFVLADKSGDITLKSEKLRVNMKYNEAMELAKTNQLEEITWFKLNFDRPLVLNENDLVVFDAGKANLNFDGALKSFTIQELELHFPEKTQEARLRFSDLVFHPENIDGLKIEGITNAYNQLNDMDVHMVFNPEEHKITLKNFSMDSDHMAMDSNAEVNFDGDCKEDFTLRRIVFYSEGKSKGKMSWEQTGQGKFTLKNSEHEFSGNIAFDEKGELMKDELPELSMHMQMEGLKVDYEEGIKQMMDNQGAMVGIGADDIAIDRFVINSTLKNGKLKVENTELVMPVFYADLDADINFNEASIEGSEINKLIFRISNIKPELKNGLKNIESMLGFQLPTEGEDIIFNVKGTLNNPQVKGIHY